MTKQTMEDRFRNCVRDTEGNPKYPSFTDYEKAVLTFIKEEILLARKEDRELIEQILKEAPEDVDTGNGMSCKKCGMSAWGGIHECDYINEVNQQWRDILSKLTLSNNK